MIPKRVPPILTGYSDPFLHVFGIIKSRGRAIGSLFEPALTGEPLHISYSSMYFLIGIRLCFKEMNAPIT